MNRFYLYDVKINNKDFIFTFDKETYCLGIYYDKKKFSTPKVKPLVYIVRKIDFYDNVENRGAFYSITKEQYEERKDKDVSRDYVAEAHENGHPYNVRG